MQDITEKKIKFENENSLINIIILLFVGLITFYISNYILYYYLLGDQYHYRRFYEAIYGAYFFEIPQLQKNYLGGSEPIYGLVMWLGSNLEIDKDTYISSFNSLTAILLMRWLILKRVNFFVILLIYTNFYFVVIMTSAERLKFSYLFFFILLNKDSNLTLKSNINSKYPYKNRGVNVFNLFLIACSILSHFQSLVTLMAFAALSSSKYYQFMKKHFNFRRLLIFILISSLILSYILYNHMDAIVEKFDIYSLRNSKDLTGLAKAAGLTIVATLISSNKKDMLLMGGLLTCFVFVIGGERLNMILVCMIVYAFVEENKLSHPFIILLLSYFSYKSIGYVISVYDHGDGFYEITDGKLN